MEIHILLAGEQIGPFSESQVRQYIGEGLVSPSDLAALKGKDDWQSVETLLANLPLPVPDSTASSIPEPANGSESAIEPSTPVQTIKPETTPLTSDRFLAIAAAQKAKRKTGPTKIVVEPIRPTTALPPVSASKDRAATKPLPRLGQLSLKHVPGKIEVPAPPAIDIKPAPEPAEANGFQPPPLASVPVPTGVDKFDWHTWLPRILSGLFYACCALVAVFIIFIISFIYRATMSHGASPPTVPLKSEVVEPASPSVEATGSAEEPKTSEDFNRRATGRMAKGDLTGALADYDQSVTLDPSNMQATYHRGLARQAKGDLSGALSDFNSVINVDPKNSKAFDNRAYVKQTMGDPDGAIADYNQAISLNPKNAVAFYNLGLIKVQKGDIDGAIAAYNSALTIDPKMAFAYYNRGNAKNTEGNIDGALADFTQALVLNPKIIEAYVNRGSLRQTKNDLDGALSDYAEALALNPKITLVFGNRALIRVQKGDLDGAIDDSSAALDLDSKYGQAYSTRGLARLGKGELEGAASDLRKFCELSPRDAGADTARLYLWLISTQLNSKGTADQDLAVTLQNDWNSPPEDFSSKIASFLLGHMHEVDLIANAASPDPSREPGQYCKAWYFAGMKRLLSGDAKTATTYFQKCVATDQTDFCEYVFARAELQTLGQNQPEIPKATIAH